MKHTPGKWETANAGGYQDGKFRRDEIFVRPEGDCNDVSIAADIRNPCTGAIDEVAEANARLIAAAPELLEACEMALDEMLRLNVQLLGVNSTPEDKLVMLRRALDAAKQGS